MSCIHGLLRDLAPTLERQVQARLAGFFGGMLRSYLPQTWVFRTEAEVASLRVDQRGTVLVLPEEATPVDVTVEVDHDRLLQALTDRAGPAPPGTGGRVLVTAHTAKGKVAYGLLRDRLGLPS